MANNIQVKDASGTTISLVTKEVSAGVHRPTHEILGYDAASDMVKVESTSKIFRDGFPGSAIDATAWDTVVGSGGAIAVSNNLVMSSGTTIASETSVTSKAAYRFPLRVKLGVTISQRIVNQTFFAELISVDPTTLIPDGLHTAALLWDGTISSQVKHRGQFKGGTATDILYTTGSSSTVRLHEIEARRDEVWFHNTDLINSTTGRNNSARRDAVIPDPNAWYKIRFRWVNGGTAPATSTDATISFITIIEGTELDVQIVSGRGTAVTGHSLGVNLTNGNINVVGNAAHDAAVSGNPVRAGARVRTAPFTTPVQDDTIDLTATIGGALITRENGAPENDWFYAAAGAIVNTTDVAVRAAQGAGIRNYITSMQVKNTNATATEFVIKDGTTVIWRGHLSASMTVSELIEFTPALRGTAATAVNVACITTGASVYANLQGYSAP